MTNAERPVQIVFAGKAHPADEPGQELLKTMVQASMRPELRSRIVFVEDYDINVARHLVQGVDVWLNTPRRPQEASGTSGEKVLLNGGLNLSVLDGWWAEAYDGLNGFAIGNGVVHVDTAEQDRRDAESLYRVLETEVVPLYYNQDDQGVPHGWVALCQAGHPDPGLALQHRPHAARLRRRVLPAIGRRSQLRHAVVVMGTRRVRPRTPPPNSTGRVPKSPHASCYHRTAMIPRRVAGHPGLLALALVAAGSWVGTGDALAQLTYPSYPSSPPPAPSATVAAPESPAVTYTPMARPGAAAPSPPPAPSGPVQLRHPGPIPPAPTPGARLACSGNRQPATA